ncbi:hypothetical protein GW915_05950 [bacterium]|nr:hypothetical protein [bacterium]
MLAAKGRRDWFLGLLVCLSVLNTVPCIASNELLNFDVLDRALRASTESYALRRSSRRGQLFQDAHTGLHAIVSESGLTSERELTVAFRGTYSLGAMFSDIGLNYPQYASSEYKNLLETVFAKITATDFDGTKVLVTGHSSGGGLAEVFAYELQEKLSKQSSLKEIKAVTFNGIGPLDWLEHSRSNFRLDPSILDSISYFHLASDRDFVARIGRHLSGNTYFWNDARKGFFADHLLPKSLADIELKPSERKQALKFITTNRHSQKVFVGLANFGINLNAKCSAIILKGVQPNQGRRLGN